MIRPGCAFLAAALVLAACGGDSPPPRDPPPGTVRPVGTDDEVTPPPPPAPSALPDLVIADVLIDPAPTPRADGARLLHRGMTYSFRVVVSNSGPGPVTGAVAVAASYGCAGRGGGPAHLFAGSDLRPGDRHVTEEFTVTLGTERDSNCTFAFTVDPDNIHPESDDSPSSNQRRLVFEVP